MSTPEQDRANEQHLRDMLRFKANDLREDRDYWRERAKTLESQLELLKRDLKAICKSL